MASNATTMPTYSAEYLAADTSGSVKGSAIAAMVICIVSYTLRIISRIISSSGFILSDFMLLGGVLACFTISSIDIHVLELGLGRHIQAVAAVNPDLSDVKTMLKYLMVNNVIYAFGQVTVKISLCLLYRQLFPSYRLHLMLNGIMIFMVLWGIAFIGVAIGSCRPVYAFWEFELQALPTTYCIDDQKWYLATAIPNILTDIAILATPIYQVTRLQLNRNSKIALVLIFLCGGFVCIVSVVRVWALFAIDNNDPTWTLTGIANWSSLEFAFAVMSASLPLLRPLIGKITPMFGAANSHETYKMPPGTHSIGSKRIARKYARRSSFSRLYNSSTDTRVQYEEEGYEMDPETRGNGITATTTITMK